MYLAIFALDGVRISKTSVARFDIVSVRIGSVVVGGKSDGQERAIIHAVVEYDQ